MYHGDALRAYPAILGHPLCCVDCSSDMSASTSKLGASPPKRGRPRNEEGKRRIKLRKDVFQTYFIIIAYQNYEKLREMQSYVNPGKYLGICTAYE